MIPNGQSGSYQDVDAGWLARSESLRQPQAVQTPGEKGPRHGPPPKKEGRNAEEHRKTGRYQAEAPRRKSGARSWSTSHIFIRIGSRITASASLIFRAV